MQHKLARISLIETAIALLFVIAFCIYFYPTENSYIKIHDTFDGNFSSRQVLNNSGMFFETNPDAVVPGIMNGLPRGLFPKFSDIGSLLMYYFGSLNGYAINFILLRLIAFFGIYLFARDHIKFKREQKGLVLLIAAAFSCLSFYTIHGITTSGIPILFWAFLNLVKNEKRLISYAVFGLFALWANFVLVGIHAILVFGCLALYYSIKEKKIALHAFAAIILLASVYILTEYMMFYMHWFNHDYQSSRSGFEKKLGLNFFGVAGNSVKLFFLGHYESANYLGSLFVPFIVFFGLDYFRSKTPTHKMGMLLISMVALFSLIVSVLDWKSFGFFYEKFPIARDLNLKRFFNFLPGLFFLLMTVCVLVANKGQIPIRILSSISLVCLLICIWRGNISFNQDGKDAFGLEITSGEKYKFKEFFDTELYKSVKREIGPDTVNNVIHLGLSPSPSKYAGLNVLDDYQSDYPKTYKEEFRKIIEGELNKSDAYKAYFDGWGARCYMYSANLFSGNTTNQNGLLIEKTLSIDTEQIRKMNGKYILSSIVIGNYKELNLELRKIIVSALDYKKVFLYKII